jgi:hypothetical protein
MKPLIRYVVACVITLAMATTLDPRVHAAGPVGIVPILLSHQCSRRELMNRGDGTWYFIKYRLDHTSLLNDTFESSEEDLREAVHAVMARRLERVVYLAADPQLHYGEVLKLVSDLRSDDPSLHVVVLTEEQTGHFNTFSWKRFSSFCLSVP